MDEGQKQDPLAVPDHIQNELASAKEDAERALEGWMAARKETETVRESNVQLRRDCQQLTERLDASKSELRNTKEKLTQAEIELEKMNSEVTRLDDKLSLAEEKAEQLGAENKTIQEKLSHSELDLAKTKKAVVQAHRYSLEARSDQLAASQETLKQWKSLISDESERLRSEDDKLKAKLQKMGHDSELPDVAFEPGQEAQGPPVPPSDEPEKENSTDKDRDEILSSRDVLT